ncbi:hypothetical protein STEG23_030941, partial [Scotinomys teguina]
LPLKIQTGCPAFHILFPFTLSTCIMRAACSDSDPELYDTPGPGGSDQTTALSGPCWSVCQHPGDKLTGPPCRNSGGSSLLAGCHMNGTTASSHYHGIFCSTFPTMMDRVRPTKPKAKANFPILKLSSESVATVRQK